MKTPTVTARLHPMLLERLEQDIASGKFLDKSNALNMIVAKYYKIKKLPELDRTRTGVRQ